MWIVILSWDSISKSLMALKPINICFWTLFLFGSSSRTIESLIKLLHFCLSLQTSMYHSYNLGHQFTSQSSQCRAIFRLLHQQNFLQLKFFINYHNFIQQLLDSTSYIIQTFNSIATPYIPYLSNCFGEGDKIFLSQLMEN